MPTRKTSIQSPDVTGASLSRLSKRDEHLDLPHQAQHDVISFENGSASDVYAERQFGFAQDPRGLCGDFRYRRILWLKWYF